MAHTLWINSRAPEAAAVFTQNLRYFVDQVNIAHKPLAFVCIGSAKITGDNLGPILGTILTRSHYPHVYGTLEKPLNALTLPCYASMLTQLQRQFCLIAVDAALGTHAQSGHMTLSDDCLRPGSALQRELPAIGHLHMTGIFGSLDSTEAQNLLPVFCRHMGMALLNICRADIADTRTSPQA